MINSQRRWPLLVILGSVVLLLAGTGLFLMARHDVRATTPAPSPSGKSPPIPSTTPPESGPQWSDWDDLGGSFNAGPSVTSWSVDRLDVFARALGQTILHRAYNGSKWSAPEDLGPSIVGGPGALARAGRIGSTSSFVVPTTSSGRNPGTAGGWATSR
ncbi:MAG TPA: hypothetical protein VJW23_18235 [Propionibacteriaceae bacterium]|nr:hypothetical protein [Propionibacteriaceae bacterium]